MLKGLITSGLLSIGAIAFGQNDESSYLNFIVDLNTAIERRDTSLLFPLLGESIYDGPGGCGYGTKNCFIDAMAFRELGSESQFWLQASLIFEIGIKRQIATRYTNLPNIQNGQVYYVGPAFNKSIPDGYSVIIASRSKVYQKPNLKSKIIAEHIKFNLVQSNPSNELENWPNQGGFVNGNFWVEVKLKNGRFGYINQIETSEGLMRTMIISKVKNSWKITGFYDLNQD